MKTNLAFLKATLKVNSSSEAACVCVARHKGAYALSVASGVSRETDAGAIDPRAGAVLLEPASIPSMPLSPAQIAQFREDGSIVLGRGGALGFRGVRAC